MDFCVIIECIEKIKVNVNFSFSCSNLIEINIIQMNKSDSLKYLQHYRNEKKRTVKMNLQLGRIKSFAIFCQREAQF